MQRINPKSAHITNKPKRNRVRAGRKAPLPVKIGQNVPIVIGGEAYDGQYDVTPTLAAQTLQTKDKLMLDDVTVNEIPVYRVSNQFGGETVYIQ